MDLIKPKTIFNFETEGILTLALQSLNLSQICLPKTASSILPLASTTKMVVTTNRLNSPPTRTITLLEVSNHDSIEDCWVVIYDRVYDVTEFLHQHPGGEDIILDYAGRDATIAFRGAGHSATAIQLLNQYQIGELPNHERLFRKSSTSTSTTQSLSTNQQNKTQDRVTIILSDIPE